MTDTKKLLELGKVFPATSDPVFKNLLKDVSCRPFLAKIINFTTDVDFRLLLRKMKLTDNNTLEDSRRVKHNEQDIMIVIDNKRINVEMCMDNKETNIIKNNTTAHKIAGNMYKTSDDYSDELIFYQINIENYNVVKNKKLITKTGMADLECDYPYPIDETFRIFHVNLLNVPNKCYNELSEEEKYFKFFLLDDICELEKLCEGDEILEHALEVLKSLTSDPDVISEFEQDRIRRYATDVAVHESEKRGEKRGKKIGEEQGKKEKQIEIAKKMLEQNIDTAMIITCTGLTKEELEKLT